MTETKTLRATVQGKIIQLNYDFITSLHGECEYCLTDAQVQMILSIVDYYGWATRWTSESGTIDQQVITDLQNGLIERLMMGCCPDNSILSRYTPNGHYQQSNDGGATWADSPQSDPRNPQPMFPPFLPDGSTEEKCSYADSVVQLISIQLVSNLADDATAANIIDVVITVVSTIMAALATTVVGEIVAALFGAIAIAITILGVAAFKAAMTSDVFDRLRCNLSQNMQADGSFTQTNLDAIYDRITSEETGIAAIFLHGVFATFGVIGLTNASHAGFGTAQTTNCCPTHDCATVWTWYNVTAVQDMIDPNTWHITGLGGSAHMALSSGNMADGCYATGMDGSWSLWKVGEGSASSGFDTRDFAIWNMDGGPLALGATLDFTFSDAPIPH